MENQKFKNKVLKAAKWSSITQISTKMVSPIINMILARLLAPEAFGVVATVQMVMSFTTMFSDAGFSKYLVQQEFNNEKEKEQSINVAFYTNLVISIILWVSIILFKDPLAKIVGNPGFGNVIAIACIQLPLIAFSSIQSALFARDLDFRTLFLVRIIRASLPLFITIPLALAGFSYWSLIIGWICGELSNAIILNIKSKWKPSLYYNILLLKKMLNFSIWNILEAFSAWLITWFDIFIIGNSFSQYYLGLYKNSLNMVNSLTGFVSIAIIPVLFTSLSRLQNSENKYRNLYYSSQKYAAYMLFPLGLGLFLYREFVTYIMLGSQWLEASNIIGSLSLVFSINIVFTSFNGEVFRSKGKPKLYFLLLIIQLCFQVPSCLLAKSYGFWPLVYTSSFMKNQGVITSFVFMKIFMGFSIKKMLKNITKPTICTFVMGTIAIFLKQISDTIVWSLFSIMICILVYFLILLFIAKDDFITILKHIKIGKKV